MWWLGTESDDCERHGCEGDEDVVRATSRFRLWFDTSDLALPVGRAGPGMQGCGYRRRLQSL